MDSGFYGGIVKAKAKVGGRKKVVLSKKQIDQVEALSCFLNQDLMAGFLGISRKTFGKIIKRDEEVDIAYKKGKATAVVGVGKSLVEAALGGNMTAAIFFLKTQGGWREISKDEVESLDDGLPSEKLVIVLNGKPNNED